MALSFRLTEERVIMKWPLMLIGTVLYLFVGYCLSYLYVSLAGGASADQRSLIALVAPLVLGLLALLRWWSSIANMFRVPFRVLLFLAALPILFNLLSRAFAWAGWPWLAHETYVIRYGTVILVPTVTLLCLLALGLLLSAYDGIRRIRRDSGSSPPPGTPPQETDGSGRPPESPGPLDNLFFCLATA